jgi:hypothetical protein
MFAALLAQTLLLRVDRLSTCICRTEATLSSAQL